MNHVHQSNDFISSGQPDKRKNELLLWTIRAFNITVEKLATKVGAWRDS